MNVINYPLGLKADFPMFLANEVESKHIYIYIYIFLLNFSLAMFHLLVLTWRRRENSLIELKKRVLRLMKWFQSRHDVVDAEQEELTHGWKQSSKRCL